MTVTRGGNGFYVDRNRIEGRLTSLMMRVSARFMHVYVVDYQHNQPIRWTRWTGS